MQPIIIRFVDTIELNDTQQQEYRTIEKINSCFASAHHLAYGKPMFYDMALRDIIPAHNDEIQELFKEDFAKFGFEIETAVYKIKNFNMGGTTKMPNSGDSFSYTLEVSFRSVVYTCIHIAPPDCYICYTENERQLKYISTGYKVIVEPH